jgi:hypothetical protein
VEQTDDAGRKAVDDDFAQLLRMQREAGLITPAEEAQRLATFDTNKTNRIKALAIELAQQGRAAAAIGDPLGDLDRLQTRLAGLPQDVEEVKTSQAQFRVFEVQAAATVDGAIILGEMFTGKRDLDPETAPTGNARERFYPTSSASLAASCRLGSWRTCVGSSTPTRARSTSRWGSRSPSVPHGGASTTRGDSCPTLTSAT